VFGNAVEEKRSVSWARLGFLDYCCLNQGEAALVVMEIESVTFSKSQIDHFDATNGSARPYVQIDLWILESDVKLAMFVL